MSKNTYNKIIERYNEIKDFNYALSLLNWDQSTYIPANGVASRSEVSETLAKFAHQLILNDDFYEDIINAQSDMELTGYQKEEVDKIRHDVERQKKIPVKLAGEIVKTTSVAMDLWQKARMSGNDKDFLPYLKKIFDLKKETASLTGYDKNPYDALLDEYDRGLKYDYIAQLFDSLKGELSALIKKIDHQKKEIDDSFLFGDFPSAGQEEFGLLILEEMGMDFASFRQDRSAHPFTTRIGNGDVRITTNIKDNDFKKGFFSTVHEGGHALYELGASGIIKNSPFGQIDSLSIHESQSRFYENIIGRNQLFWNNYFKILRGKFKGTLKDTNERSFYMAVNKVELNPIRIESDETTYNLHIILRTNIENDLINERIKIENINDIWNESMKEMFGFYPANKSEGYLQDIHWSDGLIGYFPTYTIGNLISAQLYKSMQNDIGGITKINREVFSEISGWFHKKLYSSGSRYKSMEAVKTITGEDLNAGYFIDYLKQKINDIYFNKDPI